MLLDGPIDDGEEPFSPFGEEESQLQEEEQDGEELFGDNFERL